MNPAFLLCDDLLSLHLRANRNYAHNGLTLRADHGHGMVSLTMLVMAGLGDLIVTNWSTFSTMPYL